MARPWFRFYRKTVNNPKAQRLRPELFKAWVNILCATDDDGNLGSLDDLAWTLRVPRSKLEVWVCDLIEAKLVTANDSMTSLAAHDWTDHNYDSDGDPTARDRKRKSRAMSRVTQESCHAKVTRTDTDTDTDRTTANAVVSPARRGTRLPEGFEVPDSWITDGHNSRVLNGGNPINLALEAREFVAYFQSPDCKNPVKKDWHGAWLRWCRTAKGKPNGTPRQSGAFARLYAEATAAREGQEG